jgi:hypothetical protein
MILDNSTQMVNSGILALGADFTKAETDTQKAEQQLAISNLLCNEWRRFTEHSV